MPQPRNCEEYHGSLKHASDNNVGERQDDTEKRKGRVRKRHGARNQHRHKHFCKWLLQKFPHLNESTRENNKAPLVLDVAGGKGELAARLSFCQRLNVIMVDPREADVARCFETLVLPKLPNKWQRRIEQQVLDNENFCSDVVRQRFQQIVTTFDQYTLQESVELQEAVKSASLLVGMHADGATEAVVDAALKHEKPFVVVPCCVFPNLFSERRIEENGNLVPVRTHEQFCRYLAQKDRRLVIETLPFEGRNTAIWFDPSRPED